MRDFKVIEYPKHNLYLQRLNYIAKLLKNKPTKTKQVLDEKSKLTPLRCKAK